MYSIGDELSTPVMYQDLASSSMGFMAPPMYGMYGGMYGGGYFPPLAGVNIRQQPEADKFQRANRIERHDKNVMKIAGLVLASVMGFMFCKSIGSKAAKSLSGTGTAAGGKTFGNWLGNKWTAFTGWCNKLIPKA